MAGFSGIPEGAPATVLTDIPASCANAAVGLMETRSRALADYWRSFGAVREAGDVLALNLGYCSQMMDDYAQAFSIAVAPLNAAATVEPETKPQDTVQAA